MFRRVITFSSILLLSYMFGKNAGISFDKRVTSVTVTEFVKCPGYPDLPNYYDDIRLMMDPDTKMIYVDGLLVLGQAITEDIRLHLTIRKCRDKYENSCSKYSEVDVNDFCEKMGEKGQVWTDFFLNIEGAEPKCPVPVGSYKIIHAPINVSTFEKEATLAVGFWRLRFENFMKDKLTLCCEFPAELKQRRIKQ